MKTNALFSTLKTIVLVVSWMALGFLLKENMGYNNEVHFLPLAKQFGDPAWVPGDFYYNSPPSYRLLFLQLFAPLTIHFGFLATSILGRLGGYTLIATAIVLIAQKLGIKLPTLLVALSLFLYLNPKQSMIAQEWLIGGIESKVFAYGFLLFSLLFLSEYKYGRMALCLGLTNSFHVLVGGWASFIFGLSIWNTNHWLRIRQRSGLEKLKLLGGYGIGSVFALYPLILELSHSFLATGNALTDDLPVPASFLYTFLRTPHHTNPYSWPIGSWILPIVYVGILLTLKLNSLDSPNSDTLREDLRRYGLFSLIPIGLGILAIPIDLQGRFLQYYPFRVGAILVPLIAVLYLSQWLDQKLIQNWGKQKTIVLTTIVFCIFTIQIYGFGQQLQVLKDFPVQPKIASSEWVEMCFWIRDSIPHDRLILSSPSTGDNFTWLAEHPSLVKFRLVPAASGSMTEWYHRLQAISGGVDFLPEVKRDRDNRKIIARLLDEGFNHLSVQQINDLKDRYGATYLLTTTERSLPFTVIHRNADYQLLIL